MTPILGLSSMATRLILEDLAQRYAALSGMQVAIRSMGGVDAARLVRAGEAADIAILASNVMAQLEAEGHIAPGSIRDFARSSMAIAVRAGADRPDIHDEDAVRRAVESARKVGYSTGPSGDHLLRLIDGWGLSQAIADRLLKAPPGVPVGSLVAQGDADIGFQQLSELIHAPGVDVVGLLPPEIQAVTIFAAGVCTMSSQPAQTRDLIAYLASPRTGEVKLSQGMDPPDGAAQPLAG